MNFYRRRPLALVLSLCMLVSAAAAFLPGILLKLILLITVLVGCAAVLIILARRDITSIGGLESRSFFALAAVLCTIMTSASVLYFDVYADTYDRTDTADVSGMIVETRFSASYGASYVVRLHTLDGRRVSAKGLMRTENSVGLRSGDLFCAKVKFIDLGEYYSFYDVRKEDILASGCVFACETVTQAKKTGEQEGIAAYFAQLRDRFSAKMGLYLNDDMHALAESLLLGKRDHLGRIERDIRYAGGMHLLALSGMHLAILSAALMRLDKKWKLSFHTKNIVIVVSVILYISLICFPLSAVRAGIMLILAYTAPYFNARSDRITSLFLAGTAIMLFDPTAALDISFTLSFSATLGVILVTSDSSRMIEELIAKRTLSKRMKKYIRSFFGLVYMSLGAMMFVIPLQWWYFGEISLLSLPFTLLISPLIECMLLLLWPFLILSLLGWHFLCLPLAWLVSLIGTGIEQLSALFASASPMVSLNYPFFPLILFGCMAVILCMFFDRRYHWLHALILFLLSSALFFIGIGLYRTAHSGEVTVDYINSGKNDVLLIVSDGSAMIADITDGEKTSMVRTLNRMAERCATEVDTFLLTHIHRRHVNSIRAVLSECMVRRLLIPKAADKYEAYIIQDIADLAAQYDTEILYYSREQANKIRFEDAVIEMPAYTELARSEHPLIALLVENGEASAAYACMAAWEHDAVWDFLDGADHLILGVNGPVYKSPPDTFPDGVRTYSTESEALDADIRKLAGAEISRIPALTETGILLKP